MGPNIFFTIIIIILLVCVTSSHYVVLTGLEFICKPGLKLTEIPLPPSPEPWH